MYSNVDNTDALIAVLTNSHYQNNKNNNNRKFLIYKLPMPH